MSQLTELVADILDIPVAEATPALSARTCRAWDSKAHIALMLAVEQAYGVKLSIDEMAELTSVAAIETRLAKSK